MEIEHKENEEPKDVEKIELPVEQFKEVQKSFDQENKKKKNKKNKDSQRVISVQSDIKNTEEKKPKKNKKNNQSGCSFLLKVKHISC